MANVKSTFIARAPSNIALIKYMGKKAIGNLPENASLSMTLKNLCTLAEVSITDSETDTEQWIAEMPSFSDFPNFFHDPVLAPQVPVLRPEGIEKVLKHVRLTRAQGLELFSQFELYPRRGHYEFNLKTANTFPQASGIASSASAFAAITLAVAASMAEDFSAFENLYRNNLEFRRKLAGISRQGSGSSCRSFEGPFVEWDGEHTHTVPSQLPELAHFVLLISGASKAVSSSEAHVFVKTSRLWEGRVARVTVRLSQLEEALSSGDFNRVAQIAWGEAWEMHSLFHTSTFPFSYWEPGTVEALRFLGPFVNGPNPPIVTLDAGPNPHLIVKASEKEEWKARLKEKFPRFQLLEDQTSLGAEVFKGE